MTNISNFDYNGQIISQRHDGYVNLTQMCQANGKRIDHWKELKATKAYISELQANYPDSRVVYSEEGINGGTWGHPSLAINLARWISPKFAVWCDKHLFNLITTGKTEITQETVTQSERVLPTRDIVDYIDAAQKLTTLPSGILKQLLTDGLTDQISLEQNLKYLPVAEKPKQYTIVKVRAKQLGYSDMQIGDGKHLGKFVKSQLSPSFQEMVGRYPVYHYEIGPDLDSAIHLFFQ